MDAGAHDERRGHAEDGPILAGNVARHVERALADAQRLHELVAPGVGGKSTLHHQLDPWIREQPLDQRRARRQHEEGDIDLSARQGVLGFDVPQREDERAVLRHTIVGQQAKDERPRAAPLFAHRQAPAVQLRQGRHAEPLSVKDPEGLIEKAAEGGQAGHAFRDRATLHESDVDLTGHQLLQCRHGARTG